jgi:hypothetical protein
MLCATTDIGVYTHMIHTHTFIHTHDTYIYIHMCVHTHTERTVSGVRLWTLSPEMCTTTTLWTRKLNGTVLMTTFSFSVFIAPNLLCSCQLRILTYTRTDVDAAYSERKKAEKERMASKDDVQSQGNHNACLCMLACR